MDEPLRILHMETGRHLYGGALQVLLLMEGLAGKGCQNVLVCGAQSDIGSRSRPFAKVYQIPMKGELDPGTLIYLLRVIRKYRPHLVHVHSRRGADLWGGIAPKFSSTKAVLTRRVDNPERPFLARVKYRLYDRIITISEKIRRVLLSEGVPEKKLTCVPSAVEPSRYEGKCDRNWFLNAFGLSPEAKAVGVIAQLIPRKGHRFLIQAAPIILRASPQARFLFFGIGPLREQLEHLCREKGIADRIHFAGFRPDLERILPCLDLLIHPATMEGLGVSLLQASAAGVPIVASYAGGIPEIVKNGKNGYLTGLGDVEAIARAATKLLNDPEKAHQFGHAGRKLVRTSFSPEAMVRGNLAVYESILANAPKQEGNGIPQTSF